MGIINYGSKSALLGQNDLLTIEEILFGDKKGRAELTLP